MGPIDPNSITRRTFLSGTGASLGALALSELVGADQGGPAHRPRAKNVIYLQMSGAPPQHDTFDPKPELQKRHGQLCPDSFLEGRRLAFIKGHPTLLGSPHPVVQRGSHGLEMGSLLPHLGSVADELTVIRSMHTDQFNHAPADLMMFTGNANFGYASMGSWVTWGLGSPNRNLPGFVVMVSGGSDPTGGKSVWGSGFLPSEYQGVRLRGAGDPILYVSDPQGMSRPLRRRTLDALKALNEESHAQHRDPETLARIEQYELAYRMQTSVPEVMDIAEEPEHLLEEYGAQPGQASFANNCLLARRLVESGVRFVQLFDWGWDIHGTGSGDDLMTAFPKKCRETDQAAAALIRDLARRGLLDETLVVWGGEFGRTSMNEKRNGSTYLGRDHHPDCFTVWMAGAGLKKGYVHGATDELGYNIARDPVSVHDLQATILHLCGLDPHTFRYPFQGLDARLIGVEEGPRVVTELFA
ncbi:MAG: DUF1501 domain-containing protein [Planctomycetota bacterium]|nr:DUF1501 domain-containing protein [Planctomycetota bacterium]